MSESLLLDGVYRRIACGTLPVTNQVLKQRTQLCWLNRLVQEPVAAGVGIVESPRCGVSSNDETRNRGTEMRLDVTYGFNTGFPFP